MLISIILGYRNREIERVKRSLDSLATQTCTNFELLFIDYGSDKVIASHVENVVNRYEFAKYFYSHTSGWFWNRAHALNTGVVKSTGTIILFYDIDLIPEPTFLEKLSQLSFENTFYTFSCFYLPEHFDYENRELERDGIHFEQNYVGLCAAKKEHVLQINGFDEYFMVWGAEDDDFYQSLKQYGVNHIKQPLSLYKVFHQWHHTQAPSNPTMWYLQMVQYLYNKKYFQIKKKGNWGKLISQTDRLINDNFISLKWDLELRVSSESGYLLFNPLINAINNPSLNKIYFEFTYAPIKTVTRKWFKFKNTKNTNNMVGDISNKDILDFVQYFIGIYRHILEDYSLESNYKTIKLGLVKSNESP
jgi:glycosyltransferase involved in cell wall biosynthesis